MNGHVNEREISSRIKQEKEIFDHNYSQVIHNLDDLSSGGGRYTLVRLLWCEFIIYYLLQHLNVFYRNEYQPILIKIQNKINTIKKKMGEKEYYAQLFRELKEDSDGYAMFLNNYPASDIYEEFFNELQCRDLIQVLYIYVKDKYDTTAIMAEVKKRDKLLKENAKQLIENKAFPSLDHRQEIAQYLPEEFWWWHLEKFASEPQSKEQKDD